MTIYSAFSVPTLGMMAQSHALANIGNNIANVTTGGFKRTDTNFSTVLSRTLDKQSDLGGVTPKDLMQITQLGNMVGSDRDLDLAINGQGFFILNADVNGTGQAYYGRDGSFEMGTLNDISVPGIGGTTLTTKDGYLVDKNGYFLQGWTADPTTGLFSNTTLSSLRIDPYAFALVGQTTTNAALELNLPSGDNPGLPQVTELTLSGTVETGDTFSVTVEGTTVTYTVAATDTTLNDIRTGLIAAVNGSTAISANAAATASPTDGKILITGATQGTTLTVTAATTNVAAGTNDNQVLGTTAQAAVANDMQYYNIEIFDSNGVARSVRLDFAKTATNTWTLETTVGKTPVAQVDTVTLAGTIEAGDIYSVVVDNTTFSQTVVAGDTLTTIRDALVASINLSSSTNVTAAASGTDALTLTADTAGTSFSATSSTTNRTAVAQIDNVTLTGTYAIGDQVSVDVNAIGPVLYTVVANDLTLDGAGGGGPVAGNSATAYNNITNKITAAIVGDAPTAAVVTAAASGGGTGIITMTAVGTGTAFTQASSVTSTAGLLGVTTPTPNVTANTDDSATRVNTTASVSGTELTTTSVGTMTFDANGQLVTPTTKLFNLALTFPPSGSASAGTATVDLDISKFAQFSGNFQAYSYSKNGYAASASQSIKFDASGHVIATFDDSSFRAVYKIPLAQFANANALQEYNGNVYRETETSGAARVVDVDKTGYASFLPSTHELSNVDMAGEFTRMMMTQTAYNSSSTVFKTVDEMVATARDLKR